MKLHSYLFSIFVLLLPVQLNLHFWYPFSFVYGIRVDYLSPALFLTDILIIAIFLTWTRANGFPKAVSKHWKWGIALFSFALVNIAFSQVPEISFFRWLKIFEFLAVYLYVVEEGRRETIVGMLGITVLLTFFIALFQISKGGSVGGIFYYVGERSFTTSTPGIALTDFFGKELLRPYASFSHPNALGGFALVCTFLFWESKKRFIKLASSFSVALVFLSFSLNAFLALIFTPIIFGLLRMTKKRFSLLLVVSILFSFLMLLFSGRGMSSDFPRDITERLFLNMSAGIMTATFPVLGVGLGVFTAYLPELGLRHGATWLLQPVHNIYLLVLSETGFLGLGFLYLFLSRHKLYLPLVAIVLAGLFDHYWLTLQQPFFLFAIVLALSVVSPPKNSDTIQKQ